MPNSKYILRKEQSKKSIVITFVILFVLLFILMCYVIYSVMDYEALNGTPSDIGEWMLAISSMTSKHMLPFNMSTLIDILIVQLSIWYVYLIFAAIFFIIITSRSQNDFKNVEHGSARFANSAEIKRFQNKGCKGIPLAKDTYLPLKSSMTANLNEIVIGGSGAGKSFRKIKPDILQLNGSYVITDPKGELYRDTAKMLKEQGYIVKVLNLVNIRYSNSYNPFVYITNEDDVVNIASLIMKNTAGEGEKEDFFSGAALKLLIALMMYLYKSESEIKTFGRVIRLLNSIRYKNGSIDMSCELARCFNEHVSKYPYDVASTNWGGMQANAQETQSSINEVLSTRLSLFATTGVDAITSTDEMNFDDIGKEKTAIFLIIPAARNTYKAISNIFYSQLFERLMRVAEEKYKGVLPLLVNFELDEFANIGEIPNFNEILSVVRSYNIRICIVLQGLAQLKAIYEKTYEAIIGNCDIFTLLGSKDEDTLKYISDKLDKTTARNDSRSFSRGGTGGGGGQDTEASGERPLLYPSEIKDAIKPKGKNKQYGGMTIIFVGYEKPLYLPKYDTINHPLFNSCGSNYPGFEDKCTNVQTEYEPLWKQRLKEYKKMYDKHLLQEAANIEAYEQEQQRAAQEANENLERQFNKVNKIVPPELEPSEEEYEDYAYSADRADYEPVDDFDEDYDVEYYDEDELMNDVAPISNELINKIMEVSTNG